MEEKYFLLFKTQHECVYFAKELSLYLRKLTLKDISKQSNDYLKFDKEVKQLKL